MPATEMIVSIAVTTALLFAFSHLVRLVQAWITHKTIRRAIEKDPGMAETMIERVASAPEPSSGDDRTAVILVAIGLAIAGASLIAGDVGDWTRYGLAGALFPLIVGAALGLRHYALQRARRRGAPE